MVIPRFIQFIVSSDGGKGYCAEAVGFSIYTQGKTIDETIKNIREAVDCHFSNNRSRRVSLPILANLEVPMSA